MESTQSGEPQKAADIAELFHGVPPGASRETVASVYDKLAEHYEKFSDDAGWSTYQKCADALVGHLHGRKDVKILDVGAGTGLVAKALRQEGLTNVDALDGSEGMLKVAKDQNLYKQYFHSFFTDKNENLQSNSYDALTASGIMEQVTCGAMKEMVRIVKKGGLIVMASREKFRIGGDGKYHWHLEMAKQEHDGQVRLLERNVFENYYRGLNGNMYVFEVLVD